MLDDAMNAIDWETASMEELDNLTLEDIMGGDVTDFDINNTLPDGAYAIVLEEYKEQKYAAKPEENKGARFSLGIKCKISHVLACDDADVDPEKLVGRYHFQNCPLHMDIGKAQLICLLLGAAGVDFKNKEAWKAAISTFPELLAQLIAESVAFGVVIKSKEKGGYVNTNISMKPGDYISAADLVEKLG